MYKEREYTLDLFGEANHTQFRLENIGCVIVRK